MKGEVLQILETLRPALAAEGGDLRLMGMGEGTVTVGLSGLCGTCHATLWTHRLRIERAIKDRLPALQVAVRVL